MLINTSAIACSKLGIVETRNCCGLLYRIMTLSSVGLLCFLMVWPQTDYFKVGPEAHHVPEAESWLQFSGSDHPLNSLSTQWSIHHITSHLIWRPLCCMDFFFLFLSFQMSGLKELWNVQIYFIFSPENGIELFSWKEPSKVIYSNCTVTLGLIRSQSKTMSMFLSSHF